MIGKRTFLVAALIAGFAFAVVQTQAQPYPSRPIKIVVPFPPGGPTDAMARMAADRLQAALQQTVLVENRGGGAGGSVGAKAVASSDPDGYTLLLTPPGPLTVGPAVHRNLDYDAATAFTPVGMLFSAPLVLVVIPSLPVNTLAELIAYAKQNPGKISQASQGFGVAPHLLLELLKLETGVNIVHVPYRGTAPALTDLLAGTVQMFFDTPTILLPHIQAGKLRPLAVTSESRNRQLPNVPTTTEAGYPKLVSLFWLGVVAPAGTPQPIVDKLNAALNASFDAPDVRAQLADLGADLRLGTPEDFGRYLTSERKLWTDVVTAAGIKAD
jgi:tripartite-type tricarboxylate transporter receptor subunit TctC